MKDKILLPTIQIIGTPEQLIEIETIIVMLGYNNGKEENWNNNRVKNNYEMIKSIVFYSNLSYYYFNMVFKYKTFKTKEIEKIINYVESFKTKNNEKVNE